MWYDYVLTFVLLIICSGSRNKTSQTEGLKGQEFVSHSSRSWQSKIKVSADLVFPEVSLLGW